MKTEIVNGITKLIADSGKCLVRVGTEQTIENNDTTVIYLAKSLSINDYEEKQPIEETNDSIPI